MKNKQAARSVRLMIDALFTLMETHDYGDITITDITETAGVARLTFYRHFESKDEILLEHFDMTFESYMDTLSKEADLREALCRCFDFWKQDEKTAKLLAKHHLTSLIQKPFGDYLKRVLSTDVLPRETTHFQRKFIEGGLLLTMGEWIIDAHGCTPQEMADTILDLISVG
ncbi:MAG: TetR/AcrR family transcriptional regulator [Clostridiales bacterium]|nr:TetR/AcrR family transcriptional regulator [Clostridiales bacterium]